MAGHVAPEAAKGGPIAAVQNGDIIHMDITNRRLDVELSDQDDTTQTALYKWRHGQIRQVGVFRLPGRRHELMISRKMKKQVG
jgi:dihydroxy-acid dehydratase